MEILTLKKLDGMMLFHIHPPTLVSVVDVQSRLGVTHLEGAFHLQQTQRSHSDDTADTAMRQQAQQTQQLQEVQKV